MDREYGILVVDDEPAIREMLRMQLELEGYRVWTAGSAGEARKALDWGPDLILLDVGMPGTDGFDFCASIREFAVCPILFLTAKTAEQDKIHGFLSGGDDYITKPFSVNELLARVSAHLRREERNHTKTVGKFSKELVIDYGKCSVFLNGMPVELSKKEFEIIRLLSRNAGQVFDREQIYDRVWGIDGTGDSGVIKEHIRRIRQKFGVYTDKSYISTVWGVGYKWNG